MPQLQMKHRRDSVAPPEKLDGVLARDLVGIGHDNNVAGYGARMTDERIDDGAKDGFHSERGVTGRLRAELSVDDFVFRKIEAICVPEEEEGFREAGEGGVGFEEEEAMDERKKGLVSDLEEVELVAEENGVEDATGRRSRGPAVEAAEEGDGGVFGVEMGEAGERKGRGVPEGSEEGWKEVVVVEEDGEEEEEGGNNGGEEEEERSSTVGELSRHLTGFMSCRLVLR